VRRQPPVSEPQLKSWLRFPIALFFGLVITTSLFSGLWALINVHFKSHSIKATRIEFTRLQHDTEVASIKHEEKPKFEKPAEVPATPQVAQASFSNSGAMVSANFRVSAPSIDAGAGITANLGQGISIGGIDQDAIPLVRINPDYPPRAQSRGIQGWVLVQFTITASGTVKSAVALDAEPKGYFEEAAVSAISRWKYEPKVENGVAVERRGVQVKLSFKLQG
jgi:periplasmic protein TonB